MNISRQFTVTILVTISITFCACHSRTAQARQDNAKPNIIFILADDLGYGDVGVFGQQKIETPNLDRMAAEGMRFTQFYAGTSVCAPSRSSFITGQHTGHTPIRGNREVEPEGQWPLRSEAVTIAEFLKQAGYVNGCFGKWGLGPVGSEGDPLKQGFDRFFGYNCQALAHDYFPDHLWDNDKKITLNNSPASQHIYSADLIQRQAMNFIKQHANQPFFLFLSYTLPHAALQLPNGDKRFEYYKKKFNEKPKTVPAQWNGKGYQPQAYPLAAYAAMVDRLDAYAGEVMQQLQQLNIDKNTIVLFASDNGPHREGGNDVAFFNSNAGFKGIKRDLYEGGIRTPLIARWPGKIQENTTSSYTGAFWDLFPTMAAVAGLKPPAYIDGISFLPTLLGKKAQQQHEYLYWEFHENGGRQAVRIGNWKGVRNNASVNPNSPVELYDLSSDSTEQHNVASAHPDVVARIADIMRTARTEEKDFPFWKK
ncbi:MAG: arylsulfatase [Niabella sp.]